MPHPGPAAPVRRAAALVLLALAAAALPARGDTLVLTNSRNLEGRIIDDTGAGVTVDLVRAAGRMTIPYDQIFRINELNAGKVRAAQTLVAAAAPRMAAARGLELRNPPRLRVVSALRAAAPPDTRALVDWPLVASGLGLVAPRMRIDEETARLDWSGPFIHYAGDGQTLHVLPAAFDVQGIARSDRDELSDPEVKILLHACAHALQDSRGHPARTMPPVVGRDAAVVRDCLREGEADLLALDGWLAPTGYTTAGHLDPVSLLGAVPHPDPRALADSFPFFSAHERLVHQAAAHFLHQARRLGGWRLVNQIYADPPSGTHQILHPEKFWPERRNPVRIGLPVLGELATLGYRLGATETLGELETSAFLQHHGKSSAEAAALASGWAGDTVAAYSSEGRNPVVAWFSVWETEPAAVEFEKGVVALAKTRFGAAKDLQPVPEGLLAPAGRDQMWVNRRGKEVLVIEGLPSGAPVGKWIPGFWDGIQRSLMPDSPGPGAVTAEALAALERDTVRLSSVWEAVDPAGAAFAESGNMLTQAAAGLSLTRPEAWLRVADPGPEKPVPALLLERRTGTDVAATLAVFAVRPRLAWPTEFLLAAWEETLRSAGPAYGRVERRAVKLGGAEATLLKYHRNVREEGAPVVDLVVRRGDVLWIFRRTIHDPAAEAGLETEWQSLTGSCQWVDAGGR